MKLNKESKDKLRQEIEERLKEVPEGERIKLDKEILEELIFEKEYCPKDFFDFKEYKKMLVKYIVWSGDFLSKLDLSEVSFEDVEWNRDYIEQMGYDKEDFYDHYHGVEKINLSNTNANIDFSKSFQFKFFDGRALSIEQVDFAGTDLSKSNIEKYTTNIINCNLSGTNIKFFPRTEKPFHNIRECNLTGLDLSEFTLEADSFGDKIYEKDTFDDDCNFKNTKININYDKYFFEKRHVDIGKMVSQGCLEGCSINGKLVKPLPNQTEEEIEANKQKILEEYTKFETDIYNSTITSLEEQTKKFKR